MAASPSAPFHAATTAALAFTGYVGCDGRQYYKADNAGHGFRANQNPSIAVSPTDSNIVYMVWNHYQAGWDTTYVANCCGGAGTPRTFNAGDIAFARSTDGGATWSAPQRVNDDALNNARDQFFPWLTVSPTAAPRPPGMTAATTRTTSSTTPTTANRRTAEPPGAPTSASPMWPPTRPPCCFADNNGFIGDYSGLAANSAWRTCRSGPTPRGTPASEQREYTDPGLIPAQGTPTATATACPGGGVFNGSLDATDPTFTRPFAFTQGSTCSTDSTHNYDAYELQGSAGLVTASLCTGTAFDSYLVLYQAPGGARINPFVPNGCTNALAANDDSAACNRR